MVFFVSPWLLFVLALFGAAGIYVVVQNIGILILSFLVLLTVLSIISFLFTFWPVKTSIGIMLVAISAIIAFNTFSVSKTDNTPVTIYRATDVCVIYDEAHELVQIPKDAIVARYTDPEIKSKEVSVVGHSNMCVWYYDGQVSSSTVSVQHGMDITIKKFNYEPNVWNLLEMKVITYKDFQNKNWWVN